MSYCYHMTPPLRRGGVLPESEEVWTTQRKWESPELRAEASDYAPANRQDPPRAHIPLRSMDIGEKVEVYR